MILILTGPPAAGKSTIGPLVAKQLDRCTVIDTDLVRLMVVQPHIAPWLGEEGRFQLHLGAKNSCMLARNFAEEGFHVVLLDVLTDESARIYRMNLADLTHKIVLLMPSLDESLARNRARGQFLTDDEVELLYDWERNFLDFDHKIDNTCLDADLVSKDLVSFFGHSEQ
ncbi:MAG: AAA family ATPase [Chloroflexota bacterium]